MKSLQIEGHKVKVIPGQKQYRSMLKSLLEDSSEFLIVCSYRLWQENKQHWSIGLPVSLLLAGLLKYQERHYWYAVTKCYCRWHLIELILSEHWGYKYVVFKVKSMTCSVALGARGGVSSMHSHVTWSTASLYTRKATLRRTKFLMICSVCYGGARALWRATFFSFRSQEMHSVVLLTSLEGPRS